MVQRYCAVETISEEATSSSAGVEMAQSSSLSTKISASFLQWPGSTASRSPLSSLALILVRRAWRWTLNADLDGGWFGLNIRINVAVCCNPYHLAPTGFSLVVHL